MNDKFQLTEAELWEYAAVTLGHAEHKYGAASTKVARTSEGDTAMSGGNIGAAALRTTWTAIRDTLGTEILHGTEVSLRGSGKALEKYATDIMAVDNGNGAELDAVIKQINKRSDAPSRPPETPDPE